MIIFYNNKTGKIFATIDGRVHREDQLNMYAIPEVDNKEDIGKYIIGWIQKGPDKIEYNMDKFTLLQKFEDVSPESPLDYKVDIESVNLIKK